MFIIKRIYIYIWMHKVAELKKLVLWHFFYIQEQLSKWRWKSRVFWPKLLSMLFFFSFFFWGGLVDKKWNLIITVSIFEGEEQDWDLQHLISLVLCCVVVRFDTLICPTSYVFLPAKTGNGSWFSLLFPFNISR